MESIFGRVEKTAGTQLTKMRWALAFGVVILVWGRRAVLLVRGAGEGRTRMAQSLQPGGDPMIPSGMVSILFGIVIFARPGAGALVTLALIAAFALITGITELVVAIGGKRLVDAQLKHAFAPPTAHLST